MRGYLFDANHVSAYFDENPALISRLRLVTPDVLRVCAITLGEIEAGHEMTTTTNLARREEYRKFVDLYFKAHAVEVSIHTAGYYAQIIGRIWKNNPPKVGDDTDAHLVRLGVNINDLWIVAVAWEHGLVLLTEDKMKCIRSDESSRHRYPLLDLQRRQAHRVSTAPWDQRRNATTVTVWESENRTFPPGTEFDLPGTPVERRRLGGIVRERGTIYLISWPNPNYRGKS